MPFFFYYVHAYISGVKQISLHYIPHVFANIPYLQGHVIFGVIQFLRDSNAQHLTQHEHYF